LPRESFVFLSSPWIAVRLSMAMRLSECVTDGSGRGLKSGENDVNVLHWKV
jgi:hypothetical protein